MKRLKNTFKMPRSTGVVAATVLASMISASPIAAAGDMNLPSPYVSRALDAVLLPINADVRSAFSLAADESGVLVLAVEGDGVAAAYGIEPGDVISEVRGKTVAEPIDVDSIVYYWINTGVFDFTFDGYRGGSARQSNGTISLEQYSEVIVITSVESWESWSSESFSYSEFYSEYSEEMSVSYESSETTIEETVTSEEFVSEVTTESTETSVESTEETTETATETTDEVTDEVTDEAADEVVDEATDEAVDEAVDEPADEAVDDGADEAADEPVDDGADDAADDSGGDEASE